MRAPFKRGQELTYVGVHHTHGPVTYVRWLGVERSALIHVKFDCGRVVTAHVNDVRLVAPPRDEK